MHALSQVKKYVFFFLRMCMCMCWMRIECLGIMKYNNCFKETIFKFKESTCLENVHFLGKKQQ